MRKLGLPSYTEASDSELDEYSLLNSALDDMASQLKDIDSIMHQNEQLVRDQLLYSLLFGYVDLDSFHPNMKRVESLSLSQTTV